MAEYEAGTWLVDYGHQGCDTFEDLLVDPDGAGPLPGEKSQLQIDSENVAVNILWNFTNRWFGTREVFLRPCRSGMSVGQPSTFEGRGPVTGYPGHRGVAGWLPVIIDGEWFNLRCGSCAGTCSCSGPWSIELPGPVASITEVRIGADVVPPAEYRLEGNKLIRKVDNWPTEQNIRRDPGEEGTWSITYEKGQKVPRAGELAAGILACELGKAHVGDGDCALPKRVQTITRQGVTMAILDTFEDLEKGRVGIPAVDMWIQSVRQPRSAARLPMSPDYMPGRH